MRLVFKTLLFHLLNILLFTVLYVTFAHEFQIKNNENKQVIDFVLLSTTIQAGVGITQMYPISLTTKLLVTFQQWIMLFTHILTLHIFVS
jgi:hypothetical protein